jgi:DNA invertase Pin-like site-specific DNA recombinase
MTPCKLVAYYRVSTDKQGKTGLGIDAQQEAVRRYAEGRRCVMVAAYTEVESGRKARRPELRKALDHARAAKATLVVAKLDRLARNVAFLLTIIDGNVPTAFCDFPDIPDGPNGRMMLINMANIAEWEAGIISQRTKAALSAFRANRSIPKRLRELYGENVPPELAEASAGKLGGQIEQCRNLSPESRERGRTLAIKARQESTDEAYAHLGPRIVELRTAGLTLRAIADRLNSEGYVTRSGKPWNQVQVMRVADRFSKGSGV